MRAAKRDHVISAAQVARYYGGYTLETALALSRDERELLLAVAVDQEEQIWARVGHVLGTSWNVESLLVAALAGDADGKKKADEDGIFRIPRRINLPLLPAVAPEFFENVIKGYKDKYAQHLEVIRNSGKGKRIVDLGSVSAAQAREFYKNLDLDISAAVQAAERNDE